MPKIEVYHFPQTLKGKDNYRKCSENHHIAGFLLFVSLKTGSLLGCLGNLEFLWISVLSTSRSFCWIADDLMIVIAILGF